MSLFKYLFLIFISSLTVEGYRIIRDHNKYSNDFFIDNIFSEQEFQNVFKSKIPKAYLKDFLSGAHIIFEDNGDLYYHFKSYISPEKMNKRYSLHYKAFQVQNSFSLEDLNIPETLFGKTQLNGKEVTWTQLEKHSFQGLTNKFFHTLDAMLYVITFKTYNIGPFGYSKYTSAKPLIITANP